MVGLTCLTSSPTKKPGFEKKPGGAADVWEEGRGRPRGWWRPSSRPYPGAAKLNEVGLMMWWLVSDVDCSEICRIPSERLSRADLKQKSRIPGIADRAICSSFWSKHPTCSSNKLWFMTAAKISRPNSCCGTVADQECCWDAVTPV